MLMCFFIQKHHSFVSVKNKLHPLLSFLVIIHSHKYM